jgi:hypothetical protein
MKNSRLLLLFLLLGVIGSGYYAWRNMPREVHVQDVQQQSAQKTSGAETAVNRFDFSGGQQLEFTRPKKDLFRQLFPPQPVKPAPAVVVAPPPPPPEPEVVIQAPIPPPPQPVRSVVNPMPSFTVIGYLAKQEVLTVFISFQSKIYLVKKGQDFADEFQVVGLDSQQITIGRLRGPGEVTLPLAQAKESGFSTGGPKTRDKVRPTTRIARPAPIQMAPFPQAAPEDPSALPELEIPPSDSDLVLPNLETPAPETEPGSPANDTN